MKLLMVEWEDACSCNQWEPRDIHIEITPCITVGILTYESESEVEISASLNYRAKSNHMAIPKSCIKRIRRIYVR